MQRMMLMEDAARYCGMGRTLFQELVAPHVPKVKIFKARGGGEVGKQQVWHYDRNDLDAWIDALKASQLEEKVIPITTTNSHNPNREKRPNQGARSWAKNLPASQGEATSGTSTSSTGATSFAAALSKARGQRQKRS